MQFMNGQKKCHCPSLPPPLCPPPPPPPQKPAKYYREIGSEVFGNEIIIRLERDKTKKRNRHDWEPPCDCIAIQRPSNSQGAKILGHGDKNTILFQVKSKAAVNRPDDTAKQSITYKVGACTGGEDTNEQCRLITIHPPVEREGQQMVHTDQVTQGDESVFFLRIKKQPDVIDENTRHIELELRTPRPPTPPPPPPSPPRKSKSSTSLKKKKKKKKKSKN